MEEKLRPRLRLDPSDMLLEVISIVIAILLALSVNEWRDSAKAHARAHDGLVAIRDEMTKNRQHLTSVIPHHRDVAGAFALLRDRSARTHFVAPDAFYGTFRRSNPHGYSPFTGESTAWDLARSAAILNDVPYATRAALERTYHTQALLDRYRDAVLGALHFEPATRDPNFFYAVLAFSVDLSDITYAERELSADYDAALKAVDAALR